MVAKVIKKQREQVGWTQQQFADKAKLSVPTIHKIENGYRPSKKILTKVLTALCLNIDDIIGDPDLTDEDIIYLENKKLERLSYR
jgi:transcriptional regulator with XRE-family HTH domain